MTRIATALLLALATAASARAAPPSQVEREVAALIAALGGSGCAFQRNGRWHDAADARVHLQRKYDWLKKRDLVATTEQFIERAGTESSVSGRDYAVRCPGTTPEPSAAWLRRRLDAIRRDASG